MRALFVINNPVYGGAHNELLAQRAGLAAARWESLAITPDEDATGLDGLRAAGVDVTPLRLHRLRRTLDARSHLALGAHFTSEVFAIRRVIRERAVDVVQVHGIVSPHAAIAAHLEGVAVCWHIYDSVAPRAVRWAFMPLILRLADSVTVVGNALADMHPGSRSLGERLIVTPPAVDLESFRERSASSSAARDELGVPEGAVVVGTVGNRNPSKGHMHLIEAARRLVPNYPQLAVRILGARSPAHTAYEASLRRAIAAHRLGDVVRLIEPGRRVPELLPGFDIFALTSEPRSEGMPAAVVEAMSCGLPVVATDVGAVREQVTDTVTGRLVPPNDVGALVDAIASLLGDANLRARLGAAGQLRAVREFGLERVVAARLRAFEIAVEHRRSRRVSRHRLRVRRRAGEVPSTRR